MALWVEAILSRAIPSIQGRRVEADILFDTVQQGFASFRSPNVRLSRQKLYFLVTYIVYIEVYTHIGSSV